MKKNDVEIILLKEISTLRNKVYHICDSYDIVTMKLFEEEDKKGNTPKLI